MRYLLFVSHGTLASGMTQALGMLVGALPAFKEEVEKVLAPMTAEDEIIVLADLVSGSPLTTTMAAISEKLGLANVRAIGGMNLPMAVTAVEEEDSPLDDTVSAMMTCAAEQVKQFSTDADSEDEI